MQVSKVDSVATPGAVKQTTSHFNSIDALRGFAAVGVVLYHLWNRFYPGLSTQSRALDLPVVVGGGGLDFLAVVPATIWLRRCDTVLCC
jgi:peptidoglycan/LPS O-acetylase OafA/YrhL